MPNSLTYTIVGWTLSFVIYFLIIVSIVYMLQSHNKKVVKYTASKKTPLVVTLVERQEKKMPKKQKIVEKKTTPSVEPKPTPKKKAVEVKKSESRPDFKKLFGKIELEKLPKDTPKVEKKIEKAPKSVKSYKAKEITKALQLEKQGGIVVSQRDGVFDEFRGKISDILDSRWQKTIDTVSGSKAEVIVSIDKLGNFSYKIEDLSYNSSFNAKLRSFLEEMQDVKFPPFEDGEIFNMKVIFKDILE